MRPNINSEIAHKMHNLYFDVTIAKEKEESGDKDAQHFRNQVSENYKSIIALTPNSNDASIIHECQYYSEESGYSNTWFARYFILGGDSIRIVDSSYGD